MQVQKPIIAKRQLFIDYCVKIATLQKTYVARLPIGDKLLRKRHRKYLPRHIGDENKELVFIIIIFNNYWAMLRPKNDLEHIVKDFDNSLIA